MNILLNLLLGVMLINMCILTGCFAIQCVEELRERWEKKQAKSNSKENGQ